MILAHPDMQVSLRISESEITEWIIESPVLFANYLQELCAQTDGAEGRFVLSDNDKELDIAKSIDVIINPLSIDVNDKKILTKIYSELQKLANDETMYIKTRKIVASLQEYFLLLEHNYETTLVIEDDIELPALFKLLGVKVECESMDYFERLIQYIRLQKTLLNRKMIVLVNIRGFLSNEQLAHLFEFAQYNEIHLLLYECVQRNFTDATKKYIIDIDQCEI